MDHLMNQGKRISRSSQPFFAMIDRTDWLIHGRGVLLRNGLPKACCWLAIERSGFMGEIERSGFMGEIARSGFMREED
ncbi:hypothetical protein OAE21_02815 [Rubripirellula sp.]|nr:hypothetical protein [Rubripirellula sp.]MDB4624983.1 hypothetical protein [Rubripirellula sp.]